jgi:uncharacterized membrane protein
LRRWVLEKSATISQPKSITTATVGCRTFQRLSYMLVFAATLSSLAWTLVTTLKHSLWLCWDSKPLYSMPSIWWIVVMWINIRLQKETSLGHWAPMITPDLNDARICRTQNGNKFFDLDQRTV